MSCRVYCTKEKPYWYDRVHSDMFFSLSSPTIYTLNLHSLDVAAVRDEPQSYRRDRQHSWPTLALCTVSATLYSILKYYRCWQTHHLHTVKGRTKVALQELFRLQMQVFMLSFGPCLLYLYPEEDAVPSGTYPPHLYGVLSMPSDL